MTIEEALAVLGLRRILGERQMRVQRDDKVRAAREKGDDEWEKTIHEAWAILIGKREAALPDSPQMQEEEKKGPEGTVRALCGTRKGETFVLDWRAIPRDGGRDIDEVVISNPQTLGWDNELNGYVRVDAKGGKKPYGAMAGLRTGSDAPVDDRGQSWTSSFKARITFADVSCPICKAPALQWCQYCNTVFCHYYKEHYRDGQYMCAKCGGSYVWGGGGKPIETVFDGKHLRSLTKDERKEVTARKAPERLMHKPK